MALSVLGFVVFFGYFNLNGAKIEYRNTTFVLKSLLTYAFLPVGLGFGLYFAHSKKLAMQLGWGLGTLIILAYVIGFLLH